MGDESHDAYQAEIKRMQAQYAPAAEIPYHLEPGKLRGGPRTPAVPINDRIRALSGEVADAADVLAERRQGRALADRELRDAEARFADISAHLSQLLEECGAVGNGTTLRVT